MCLNYQQLLMYSHITAARSAASKRPAQPQSATQHRGMTRSFVPEGRPGILASSARFLVSNLHVSGGTIMVNGVR